MHAAVGPVGPIWVPRAPLGPSVTRTAGMPSRGTAAVVHMSTPAVSEAFSSRVISPTSSAMLLRCPSDMRPPSACG